MIVTSGREVVEGGRPQTVGRKANYYENTDDKLIRIIINVSKRIDDDFVDSDRSYCFYNGDVFSGGTSK